MFGRLSVTRRANSADRMVASSKDRGQVMADMGTTHSRSVCDTSEQEDGGVCVAHTGFQSVCSRCTVHRQDRVDGVCLSAHSDPQQSGPEDSGGGLRSSVDRFILATAELVPGHSGPPHRFPTPTPSSGPSSDAIQHVLNSLMFSVKFLCYLHEQKELAVSTTCIAGYRTAFGFVLRAVRGLDFGHGPAISSLIAPFAQDVSRRQDSAPIWNLALVLQVLTQAPVEPMLLALLKLVTFMTFSVFLGFRLTQE